ncbi:MAG TPA: signal recognition particle-docking protein FtsY [Acidimicrobiales bacterium]|nr:signal recognition particle-docking protein FtsY [Acidimicrobiales bacterium]
MIALWIALAAVAIAVLVMGTLSYATSARRRGGGPRPETGVRARRPPTRPPSAPKTPPPPATRAPEAPGEARAPTEVAPVEVAPVEVAPVEVAPPTFRERMGRTRGVFSGLRSMRAKAIDPATWDELEESLLRADVGVATTDALLDDLRRRVREKEIGSGDELLDALRGDLVDLLALEQRWDAATDAGLASGSGAQPGPDTEIAEPVGRQLRFEEEQGVVNVWLFVGVNGVGKTTTVGKVARLQAAAGRSVLLAAGDTFRAAAGEQLGMWAERAGAEIVRGAEGGDPSAVVFDAVQRAAARGNSLVLADTAGRLHTKANLVEELKKIRRVAERPPGRVTEVLLVIDATTGQNGLVQARQFTEAVAVTGVVLTKLDGTAKGGIVVAIQRELGLPVKLVGLGEGPDDLVPFDPADFVGALLG